METWPLEVVLDSAGLAEVRGFRCGAAAAGIRLQGDPTRLDVAVLVSDRPAAAVGVFTTNDVKAAPVLLCQEHLGAAGGVARVIVVNSGNANACTGEPGMADARAMAAAGARVLGTTPAEAVPLEQVLVCSTGRIGRALPMPKVLAGIAQAGAALRDHGTTPAQGQAAAQAILTSDTRPKTVTVRFRVPGVVGASGHDGQGGEVVTVAGIAKGAGMIEPNMATMLAFLATDAAVERDILAAVLREAVRGSFNACTVDGDMSTNDTVLLLANGASGVKVDRDAAQGALFTTFQRAVAEVCRVLAEKIVGDGERITKVVRVQIQGAPSDDAAERVARAIGNSLLVKSSWFGNDPNWGRVMDAAGKARVGLQEPLIDLDYNDVPVLRAGVAQEENLPRWRAVVAEKHFSLTLNLHLGPGTFTLLATDLSTGYVDFNKSE